MNNPNKTPELKDIVEMINRYNATNVEGYFVFRFVGFSKDKTHKCEDCGEECSEYDDTKSLIGAYGYLEDLRMMINELRDVVEDNINEDGFICVNEFGENDDE